ncbi:Sec-independent protein translocase subunit TatA/TatB [Fodinibius halophilus]|uniref:Sec-independent protein translocase protein TatA n=1 Tax=Fodinibius halophilus TaxID=1736908 RepID=A0A6M1TAD8_9BACT|nr:twin-arginine translocase TatA/TatE family subunit [Fodinibius halophilus]NGP87934.1 twin-arginine translocase TatA/TatE family subunit [Fodinibius halophilus]
MLGGFGGMEVLIILLVVLLFFGAKRIPELARGIGQGINEFQKASDEIKKEIEQGGKEGLSSESKEKEEVKNKEN